MSAAREVPSRSSLIAFERVGLLLARLLGGDRGVGVFEFLCSLSPALTRFYCLSREPLLRSEYDCMASSSGGLGQEGLKVVMVGGGPVPATAIYWAERFDGPIVVLEKSSRRVRRSRKLLERLGFKNVEVVCTTGESYDGYANSITLLSLFLTHKTQIADRALQSAGRQTVCVRVRHGESFDADPSRWRTVKSTDSFEVVVAVSS